MSELEFRRLNEYLQKVPAINGEISHGVENDGRWWVKFHIDIKHDYAWHAVQELAHVLNYISVDERLPTNFHPVSPPPYMNGGPDEYLSWVIESQDPEFTPDLCAEWLDGRLPSPVEDLSQWETA